VTASLTIIRPQEFIVIAADSCQTDGFGKQTGSTCKVVTVGNFVYVANSFIYHDEPRFDLAAIFKRIGAVESLSELVATVGKARFGTSHERARFRTDV
jgi:hypothetical protein